MKATTWTLFLFTATAAAEIFGCYSVYLWLNLKRSPLWLLPGAVTRLTRLLVVLTLTLSLGAHWVLLQSVAWMGMVVHYSQNATVTEALSKTFDGQHPCKLCKFVKEGKQSEK